MPYDTVIGRRREILEPRDGKERRTPAVRSPRARGPLPVGVSRLRPARRPRVPGVRRAPAPGPARAASRGRRRMVGAVRVRRRGAGGGRPGEVPRCAARPSRGSPTPWSMRAPLLSQPSTSSPGRPPAASGVASEASIRPSCSPGPSPAACGCGAPACSSVPRARRRPGSTAPSAGAVRTPRSVVRFPRRSCSSMMSPPPARRSRPRPPRCAAVVHAPCSPPRQARTPPPRQS